MKVDVYHNPRCSKSRCAVELLENNNIDFNTIKYLDTPLNAEDLKGLLKKLEMKPEELLRKGEAAWKQNFKGKQMSDEQIIAAMVEYPKLIERPIVVSGNKAVVGRPVEKVAELLQL